jgi:hypothetical protein
LKLASVDRVFGLPVDVEVSVIERLKLYDWTFSATAEAVVGTLLAVLLVVSVFAFRPI